MSIFSELNGAKRPPTPRELEDMETALLWARDPVKWVEATHGVSPTLQQGDLLSAYAEYGAHVSCRSGHGCFGAGTPILLLNGLRVPVEDVRVGDVLFGDDGTTRTVLSLKGGREALYRFEFNDGVEYVFNESHLLCLVATQSHGSQETGDKVLVTVGEYLQWSKRRRKTHAGYRMGVDFPLRPTSELRIPPYVLGAWLGDGHSNGVGVSGVDEAILDEFRAYGSAHGLRLKKRGPCTYELRSGAPTFHHDNPLKLGLVHYGLIQNKHIPLEYLTASRADRLELLAGLVDTDGTKDPRAPRTISIIQKRRDLAEDILFLARSLGMHATIRTHEKSCMYEGVRKRGMYHNVTMSRNTEMIPCRLARKRADGDAPKQRENLHVGVRSVTPLGEGDYYGFTLDGNHRFLGGDFMVLRNTGKTGTLAWIIEHFLTFMNVAHDPSCLEGDTVIPCTAPTAHQLNDLLWPEVQKWLGKLRPPFASPFRIVGSEIRFLTGREVAGKPEMRVAKARTSRKENPDALQGFHATNLLFLLDEFYGIPDEVFEVAEGAMSTPGAKVIMTGNPTKVSGYAFKTQQPGAVGWKQLHFSCLDSPLVSREYCENMLARYGERSPVYRVRVLGEHPLQNEKGLISYEWVQAALDRDIEPLGDRVAALDVGRGGDPSALVAKHGKVYTHVERWYESDTMALVGAVYKLWQAGMFERLFVDSIGVGGPVADRLRQMGVTVYDVNVAEMASRQIGTQPGMRMRDELWWALRDRLHDGVAAISRTACDAKTMEDFMGELTVLEYDIVNGKIKVEGKKEMKARLGKGAESPNMADAAMMCEADGVSVVKGRQGKARRKEVKKVARHW